MVGRKLLSALAVLSIALQGCVGSTSSILGGSDDLEVPDWEIGDWWLFTFTTPEFYDDSARLVVATVDEEEGGTAYMLGISSEEEARRHAVLNHNPFLGRITHEDLSAFENGVPQPVLDFPLVEGAGWGFTLFSTEWSASVRTATGGVAVMEAEASDGSTLDYVYDSSSKFFSSFIWTDSSGVVQLRMMLADDGESCPS